MFVAGNGRCTRRKGAGMRGPEVRVRGAEGRMRGKELA